MNASAMLMQMQMKMLNEMRHAKRVNLMWSTMMPLIQTLSIQLISVETQSVQNLEIHLTTRQPRMNRQKKTQQRNRLKRTSPKKKWWNSLKKTKWWNSLKKTRRSN